MFTSGQRLQPLNDMNASTDDNTHMHTYKTIHGRVTDLLDKMSTPRPRITATTTHNSVLLLQWYPERPLRSVWEESEFLVGVGICLRAGRPAKSRQEKERCRLRGGIAKWNDPQALE